MGLAPHKITPMPGVHNLFQRTPNSGAFEKSVDLGKMDKSIVTNKDYNDALKKFDVVISGATSISQGAAGRPAQSSQHFYASTLFTRLCTSGVSLLYLSPRSRLVVPLFSHWDFSAIASLTRNLIECYTTFYYLCIDQVSEDEWNCRWNLFNLHDCLRRRKMFECFGENAVELKAFDDQAAELKARLLDNSCFSSLKENVQKDHLKAKSAYLFDQDTLAKRIGLDAQFFRGLYIFLSSQVHTYPLGFYRTGEKNRGRGLENGVEKGYIEWMLSYATYFVRRASKEMVVLFPDSDQSLSKAGRDAIFDEPEEDLDIISKS